MPLSSIIIEDQLPAQRILIRYVEDVAELQLKGTFTDPLTALSFLRHEHIDLIFLDVHLPKMSGMEFLKVLPYKTHVILTTAFSEYALEGYEFDVADYLLKPISLDRFVKAVSKVIYPVDVTSIPSQPSEPIQPSAYSDYIFVKSDRSIVKLDIQLIVYIKSDGDYTRIYTPGKNHFLSYTLKYWVDLLPDQKFCRIHKSYLINIDYVEKIEGNQVFLAYDDAVAPIGRSYRDRFMERINLKE